LDVNQEIQAIKKRLDEIDEKIRDLDIRVRRCS